MRVNLGGILGLKADFAVIDKLLQPFESGGAEKAHSNEVRRSFHLILKAIVLSWGSFSDGPRAFQFQMCGRLSSLRNHGVIFGAVMKSFETHTPKPYLVPVCPFFLDLDSAQILEIHVGGWCGSLVFSPCGRYILAGGGHNIVVAD